MLVPSPTLHTSILPLPFIRRWFRPPLLSPRRQSLLLLRIDQMQWRDGGRAGGPRRRCYTGACLVMFTFTLRVTRRHECILRVILVAQLTSPLCCICAVVWCVYNTGGVCPGWILCGHLRYREQACETMGHPSHGIRHCVRHRVWSKHVKLWDIPAMA